MNIKVKEYYKNEFLEQLKDLNFEFEYSDTLGYYRIYDKKVLVGKLQIWNNVLIYYLGLAQKRFINDLIINFNKYLEFYETNE